MGCRKMSSYCFQDLFWAEKSKIKKCKQFCGTPCTISGNQLFETKKGLANYRDKTKNARVGTHFQATTVPRKFDFTCNSEWLS